jgi:hypothetical protein
MRQYCEWSESNHGGVERTVRCDNGLLPAAFGLADECVRTTEALIDSGTLSEVCLRNVTVARAERCSQILVEAPCDPEARAEWRLLCVDCVPDEELPEHLRDW